MKYQLKSNEDALDVEVSDIGAKREELLGAFQECQEGSCSCPTDEYDKLESMEIEDGEDAVRLRLKSKPGEHFDETEVDRCLAYTRDQMSKKG